MSCKTMTQQPSRPLFRPSLRWAKLTGGPQLSKWWMWRSMVKGLQFILIKTWKDVLKIEQDKKNILKWILKIFSFTMRSVRKYTLRQHQHSHIGNGWKWPMYDIYLLTMAVFSCDPTINLLHISMGVVMFHSRCGLAAAGDLGFPVTGLRFCMDNDTGFWYL